MRTIYSLLAELERNSLTDMELTEDLFALQTLLSTFNDHVKPFRNLQLITGEPLMINYPLTLTHPHPPLQRPKPSSWES